MKYTIRGEQEAPVVELWLTRANEGNRVYLHAGTGNGKGPILSIDDAGITLCEYTAPNIGSPLDHRGRVRVANQSVNERYADELREALVGMVEYTILGRPRENALQLLNRIEAEGNSDG